MNSSGHLFFTHQHRISVTNLQSSEDNAMDIPLKKIAQCSVVVKVGRLSTLKLENKYK